jgi:hypothetical protein
LCSSLHPPVTPAPFGLNILLSTVLKYPQSVVLPKCQRPSFALIQNHRQKLVLYI